jgi:hypothetical protein
MCACGSGPFFGEPPFGDDVGYVGSGGRGHDAGHHEFDASSADGSVDSGSQGGMDSAITDSGNMDEPIVVQPDDGGSDSGSGIGITINLPAGFFMSLDWTVVGPAGSYSGSVEFGHAHSIEFVIGGIQAGDDYVLTLSGIDAYGQPCMGSSTPFSVHPGQTAGTSILLQCRAGEGGAVPGNVTTGNVAVDAGVLATMTP